jgi:hypothetical protein
MRLYRFALIASLCAIGLGVGCAGGSLGRVTPADALPTELSKEEQQKFEVSDLTASEFREPEPRPSPSPAPQAVKAPKHSKKRKGKQSKATPPGEISASPEPSPSTAPAAQTNYPSRRPAKDPIWIGEKMVFDITYFGMSAGDFTLEAMPLKAIDNRKVYHIKGLAESSKVFSLFYRLHDMVETFLDYDGLFSHRFHILLDETKQARDSLELYDSQKKQTFYWNRWNHKERGYTETKEFQPIEPFSQDSLSALYFLRTLPLIEGAVYNVPVVSEGKSWEAVVTVVRRETMRSPMGKVQCVVLKPETKYQGVLKKQGDSFLWLTDDDRRTVVRLEAKVRIGTVIAQLKKFEPGTPP